MTSYAPQRPLGVPHILLASPSGASTASIATYGAHVLSWQCRGSERLYLSPLAAAGAGQSIRGGVPVIFPQFGTFGSGPRHGFARLRDWAPCEDSTPHRLCMVLREDADTLSLWPHPFEAKLKLELPDDGTLRIGLTVRNTGASEFAFTAALHTYLRVADLAHVHLRGLRHTTYLDAAHAGERRVDRGDAVRFEGEVDRVYLEAPALLELIDGDTALAVKQVGFADTVVWNPGATLAARLADLPPGGYRHFVCVEAASASPAIRLAPGSRWHGSQSLIG